MNLDNFSIAIIIIALAMVGSWLYVISRDRQKMNRQIQELAEQHTLFNTDDKARTLCRAIHRLRPNARAVVDYLIKSDSNRVPYIAEWRSTLPQPTDKELASAVSEVSVDDTRGGYAALRRSEYPSIGDQLDAGYKARQSDTGEQTEIDRRIAEIKNKYPKPTVC